MRALEKKTGQPNPRLRSRPKLRTEDTQYFDGYRVLCNSRQITEAGLQPFQLSEILAYMNIVQLPDGLPRRRFVRMVQALDSVHQAWFAEKQKAETEKIKNKKGKR